MRFTFIHAADLHIDSPLAGLSLKDKNVAERFAQAGRRAVETLVQETITSKAAFLVIAGDIFDGDWKDVTTGLFFVRTISALHREGIPVFIVKGNHDADSVMSRELPYPPTVRTFSSTESETLTIDELRVALHGRSFPNRWTGEFVQTYPQRKQGWLNIGVLHTSLDGTRGHQGYAPCSVDDLKRFGYDYWALGHIHAAEVVNRDPWIVFPGNIQGRSIRETGAKGAMRVTVEDGRIIDVTPVPLDGARWAHIFVDIAQAVSEDEVISQIDSALTEAHTSSDGRPLAARIALTGVTSLHNRLVAQKEALQEDLRARAFGISDDLWVESLKLNTSPKPLPAPSSDDDIDIDHLLAGTATDPEFADTITELIDGIKGKLPKDLQDGFVTSDAVKTLLQDARALLAAGRT